MTIRKGISQDQTYVVIDKGSGWERFVIKEKQSVFLGYGTHIRTPDITLLILGQKYEIYYADGRTIKIPFLNDREMDGIAIKID